MSKLFKSFREMMCDFDNVFTRKPDYFMDNDTKVFYKEKITPLIFSPMSEDKQKIKSDFSHISSDINKSLTEYKETVQL